MKDKSYITNKIFWKAQAVKKPQQVGKNVQKILTN